jgi:hypothetical protein
MTKSPFTNRTTVGAVLLFISGLKSCASIAPGMVIFSLSPFGSILQSAAGSVATPQPGTNTFFATGSSAWHARATERIQTVSRTIFIGWGGIGKKWNSYGVPKSSRY